jgi:hypothetical protein
VSCKREGVLETSVPGLFPCKWLEALIEIIIAYGGRIRLKIALSETWPSLSTYKKVRLKRALNFKNGGKLLIRGNGN